LLKIFCRFFIL